MYNNVLVIGAGAWGTTISILNSQNVKKVFLYSRDSDLVNDINFSHENKKKLSGIVLPDNIKAIDNFSQISDVKNIVIAIPVQAISSMCEELKKFINPDAIIISSKGIDNKSLKFPTEIVRDKFPNSKLGIISGPNFAMEVAQKKFAKTLVVSKDKNLAKYLQNIFKTDYFIPKISNDLIGVEICGAIKNVIAIAIGIAKGLELGENFVTALILDAIEEIKVLLQAYGECNVETVYSLAGLGDLLLSCTSLTSRNTKFGYEFVKNDIKNPAKFTVEGYYTAKSIFHIIDKMKLDMPICKYVYDVLYNDISCHDILKI